jgi:4-hydroxybenzoate polyprenyltransferase/phosphoserine phosphatase
VETETVNVNAPGADSAGRPLVVDVDGTLIRSDLLIESAFAYLGSDASRALKLPSLFLAGKAHLKAYIAAAAPVDTAHLPYNEQVLDLVREARDSGRPVFLASASNERYVRRIADHLGLFDGWFASTDTENLKTELKAQRLKAAFGEKGFDYAGNDADDIPVWAVAKHRIAISPSPAVKAALIRIDPDALILGPSTDPLRAWLKLLRVHQWAKNALVFLPAFAAHRFDGVSVVQAFLAAASFSLAASSIYILNDLVDLDADRAHRSKRLRPLAAGTASIRQALVAAPLLLLLALALGLLLPWLFLAVLAAYLALTTAYTFYLKRKMMVDIVTLASLYTLRVLAGAAAAAAVPSEWILAFSMFIFTSLALMKRYVELAARLDASLPDPTNRNYRKSDLATLGALAAASGFNAVTVFALYISSDTVHTLYRHPKVLWLICPILLYWVGRALILADRRLMDDDPIMFALKDRVSLLSFASIAFIMVAAAWL